MTPVLLRRGGLTGHIYALTDYRILAGDGGEFRRLEIGEDGKHDVTADFHDLIRRMSDAELSEIRGGWA